MFPRGIGIEGVASEIGALGRENLSVNKEKLIKGLCHRFGATNDEAIIAIQKALEAGTVKENCGYIILITD